MANIEKQTNYVERYSVAKCLVEFRKVKTGMQAFKSGAKTLAKMKKEAGYEKVLTFIKIWLVNLNDFVNVARKLTPPQIEELAIYIYEDFHYLNAADIHLFFTNVKRGRYGELYGQLDGMKILEYLNQYEKERAMLVCHEGDRDHDKMKYNEQRFDKPLIDSKINKIKQG